MCHQNNYDNWRRCIIVVKKVCEQILKNIFNKNDNDVGLLRSVKKVWIMGLVMSHTYNLSHACKSTLHQWPYLLAYALCNSNVRQAVIA